MNDKLEFVFLTPENLLDLDCIIKQVLTIDKKEMVFSWSAEAWRDFFINQNFLLVLAFFEKRLVGFSVGRLSFGNDFFELDKIAVCRKDRRLGAGSKIFSFLIHKLSEQMLEEGKKLFNLFLELESSNTGALAFYNKLGFFEFHRVKKYYSSGGDAIKMQKTLIL